MTIGFNQTGYAVQESVGVVSVSVRLLSGQLDEEVSVRLTSSDGTAAAGMGIGYMESHIMLMLRISSFYKFFMLSNWLICMLLMV